MTSRNVHLFVFDTVADWEAAFAIATINNQDLGSGPAGYRVVTVAASLAPVTTLGGMRIQPDVALEAVTPEASAMLILPGGRAWEAGGNDKALGLASQFIHAGVPVAAICAATQALARAGSLDRLSHGGDAREYLISTGSHGTAFYCGAPALAEDNVISAAGFAPIDFAREIFSKLKLYSPASLDSWYQLFKFGHAAHDYNAAREARA